MTPDDVPLPPLCEAVRERLPALVDTSLPAGESELVRFHLLECPACAAEHARFAALAGVVAADRPDGARIERLIEALQPALSREAALGRRRRAALLAAAAALLIACGLLALLPKPDTSLERFASLRPLIERPITRTVAPLRRLVPPPRLDGGTR